MDREPDLRSPASTRSSEDTPAHAEADGIDLVLVRRGRQVHVFEGRCPHRGALLADGRVEGANLICGVHGWDYRLDTGVSAYNPAERIYKFSCHVVDGEVLLDKDELVEYRSMRPERARRVHLRPAVRRPAPGHREEPFVAEIHGWPRTGCPARTATVAAMGVPRDRAPAVGRPADRSPRSCTASRGWTTKPSTRR